MMLVTYKSSQVTFLTHYMCLLDLDVTFTFLKIFPREADHLSSVHQFCGREVKIYSTTQLTHFLLLARILILIPSPEMKQSTFNIIQQQLQLVAEVNATVSSHHILQQHCVEKRFLYSVQLTVCTSPTVLLIFKRSYCTAVHRFQKLLYVLAT